MPVAGRNEDAGVLRIRPRYYRWHVDPGVEWTETNTGYALLDWPVPVSQAALVLIDVWEEHYLEEPHQRAEKIIREDLRPLMQEARKAGLLLIHAPSPEQARGEPGYLGSPGAEEEEPQTPQTVVWPPSEFRDGTGPYAVYARPPEPREPELEQLRRRRRIHPLAVPEPGEPVVATGAQLHQVCAERGILFLFFAGFNTNACILLRDYGTLAMSRRGYRVILVRDCTTGMESAWTQSTLAQTRGAVLFLEMFGQYSISGAELRAALTSSEGD